MQVTEQDIFEYLALGDEDFKAIYHTFAVIDRNTEVWTYSPSEFLEFFKQAYCPFSPGMQRFEQWLWHKKRYRRSRSED